MIGILENKYKILFLLLIYVTYKIIYCLSFLSWLYSMVY